MSVSQHHKEVRPILPSAVSFTTPKGGELGVSFTTPQGGETNTTLSKQSSLFRSFIKVSGGFGDMSTLFF